MEEKEVYYDENGVTISAVSLNAYLNFINHIQCIEKNFIVKKIYDMLCEQGLKYTKNWIKKNWEV